MGHDVTHAPFVQICPAVHCVAAPQVVVLQNVGSDARVRQTPSPQSTCPEGQDVAQAPATQTRPPEQTVPAELPPSSVPHPAVAPQKEELVCGSMHAPLHAIVPAVHESVHTPALQTSPRPQGLPHVPQLLRSACKS